MESAFTAVSRYDGRNGETITLVRLPLADILTPGFQRERLPRHISKIAAELDATAYAFPVVALFKGNFLALDGQQRLAALEALGEETVTVLLVEGIASEARLADLFLKINRDRKLLNAFQKYVAALESRDRGTVEMKRLLDEFSLEAAKSASANGKVPVGAIAKIFADGGTDLARRVLMLRTQAWPVPSKEANESKTLLGLALFIRRNWDKLDDGRAISVLAKHHPGYLLEATDQSRGSFFPAYSDYIRDLYNKGLRGKGRL